MARGKVVRITVSEKNIHPKAAVIRNPTFQNNHELLVNALKKLKTISELEDNWNDNGAKHFEKSLLVQCYVILTTLERFPPEIFPVADGSIQFEFEKSDGSYLEFDIFENEVSEYRVYPDGREIEQIVDKNKISEEVNDFYEQSDKYRRAYLSGDPPSQKLYKGKREHLKRGF